MLNPLTGDLDHVLAHTAGIWEDLRGGSIFLTGGTGFFGCWLLESFLWANERLDLRATATVLTRDAERFGDRAPHIANAPAVRIVEGDVRSFAFPRGRFTHVIHAATDASAALNRGAPLGMFDTIVEGTRRVLDFAVACRAKGLLLTSSGAVYGKEPAGLRCIPESCAGAPDPTDTASAYAEGKRAAELLCAIYHRQYGLATRIARGFAFVGPYMRVDAHFAIGNFINDALHSRPIEVNGDGTAVRSYLYAADLAIWLWTILLRGRSCRPYNVGSEQEVTIAELAATVAAEISPSLPVHVAGKAETGRPADRYVPSVRRAAEELGLAEHVPLVDAIHRTHAWFAARKMPVEVCA